MVTNGALELLSQTKLADGLDYAPRYDTYVVHFGNLFKSVYTIQVSQVQIGSL